VTSRKVVTLDPAPLLELVGPNQCAAAQACGVSRRHINRWANGRNRIRPVVAERIADRLGMHPANIWTDYYEQTVAPCGTALAYRHGCFCDDCRAAWYVSKGRTVAA